MRPPRTNPRWTLASTLLSAGLLAACGGSGSDGSGAESAGAPVDAARIHAGRVDTARARAQRLERDAADLRASIARMEALDLHDAVVESVAQVLASGDEGTWRRSGGWGFRTFEIGYWTGWARREKTGGGTWRYPALDFTLDDHPFHAIVRYARLLEARGIDFLLVPVPARTQVYPERLPGVPQQPDDFRGIDMAYATYLLALVEAGVEVVDLLPHFAAERFADPEQADALLYHAFDRHWTPRGARLAARLVAERVRQLPCFEPGPLREGEDFVIEREKAAWTPRPKPGMPESEQAVELWFERVVRPADREPLEPDRSSPIVVLGDSFLNHLEEEAAGVGSLLSAELRTPLDTIALPGGGSVEVWQALARRGDGLAGKTLVVWISGSDQLADPRLRFVDLFAE